MGMEGGPDRRWPAMSQSNGFVSSPARARRGHISRPAAPKRGFALASIGFVSPLAALRNRVRGRSTPQGRRCAKPQAEDSARARRHRAASHAIPLPPVRVPQAHRPPKGKPRVRATENRPPIGQDAQHPDSTAADQEKRPISAISCSILLTRDGRGTMQVQSRKTLAWRGSEVRYG